MAVSRPIIAFELKHGEKNNSDIYYFLKTDSLVKAVVFYFPSTINNRPKTKAEFTTLTKDRKKRSRNKFDEYKTYITHKVGKKPKSIKKKKNSKIVYYTWETENGLMIKLGGRDCKKCQLMNIMIYK